MCILAHEMEVIPPAKTPAGSLAAWERGADFRLSRAASSRSFADMRVEILAHVSVPKASRPAADNRALQAFLGSLNTEDSLFRATTCVLQPAAPASAETPSFSGGVVLSFSKEAHNRDRGLYYILFEKLAELLKEAGSADALEVRLGLCSQTEPGAPAARHSLVLELISRGSSREQAELRWGLGIVHIQQALLFTSRLLRQQLSARND